MHAAKPLCLVLALGCGAAQADRIPPGPAVRSIALPTGVTLEYTEQGDARGTPVVLLHGYTDSRHSWDLVLPHLSPRFRVFAISQRGHGVSSRPATGYRTEDFAADARAFLDAKEIDHAVLVGHSMGSMVAQRFAIDHPGRVTGLVLTGAFYMRRDHPVLVDFWNQAIASLPDSVEPAFVLDFQRGTLAGPVPADFFDTILRESSRLPGWMWRDAFRAFLATDFSAEMSGITAPTLILWGDRDAFSVRADQDSLVARIRGSRLTTYLGTGHSANWEQPERFAADVTAFVDALSEPHIGGQLARR